jgi:hypothetical protein
VTVRRLQLRVPGVPCLHSRRHARLPARPARRRLRALRHGGVTGGSIGSPSSGSGTQRSTPRRQRQWRRWRGQGPEGCALLTLRHAHAPRPSTQPGPAAPARLEFNTANNHTRGTCACTAAVRGVRGASGSTGIRGGWSRGGWRGWGQQGAGAGLGHRLVAVWARVRAAFGDG